MIYADTSVIVKLYIKEEHSRETSDWIKNNDEAVPLTLFHELEFTNAVKSKQFRHEMSQKDADLIFKKFEESEQRGVFYRPHIDWTDVFARSLYLSKTHTNNTGSRSLDIIHVSSALSIGANRMVTFDERQSQLALAAGLRIITPK